MPNKNVVMVNVYGMSIIDIKKLKKLATKNKSTVESTIELTVKKFLTNGCKLPVLPKGVSNSVRFHQPNTPETQPSTGL